MMTDGIIFLIFKSMLQQWAHNYFITINKHMEEENDLTLNPFVEQVFLKLC